MTTTFKIELLSKDPRLRMQVEDEINSRHIRYEPTSISGRMMTIVLDEDNVSREDIISCLSEGVLEYIGDIRKSSGFTLDAVPDSPFKTADSFL